MMGWFIMRATVMAALVGLFSACATSGNPAVLDQTIVSQIKLGQSTKDDVRRLLGEPTHTSLTQIANHQNEVWAYGFARHETNPLIYVPVVGLFVMAFGGWGEHESGSVAVSFGEDGIVRSLSKHQANLALGGIGTPTTIKSQSNTEGGTPTNPVRFDSQTNINTNR